MAKAKVDQALEFVRTAQLPEPPITEGLEGVAAFDFDAARDQAAVVGSDIVSFVHGVTADRRRDIVNATLLAQLVANQKVPDQTNTFAWYDEYFNVLSNTGWVVQSKQFVNHVETSENLHAHEAIIAVATALLGPGTAALQVIKTTLDALASMDKTSPWITLFNRESQHASTARFQVTLAEQGEADQFLVTLMAFALDAEAKLTQVLFFKFNSNQVTLRHSSGKLSINSEVLTAVRPLIEQKLANFASTFVKTLPDLQVKAP